MSQRIEDGGPAYPVAWQETNEYGVTFTYRETGMSLRDYFAGQALAGFLSNPGGPFQANDRNGWNIVNCTLDDVARCAYEASDAMLSARQMGLQTGGEA